MHGWDVNMRMLETAPGFSILYGKTDNRIDNQGVESKRIWMAWN